MNRKQRFVAVWLAVVVAATTMAAVAADPISGRWAGTFDAMGQMVPFTLSIALDGSKVTAAVDSEHTGAGKTENGVWKDGVFSMTFDFENHQSIAFTGKPTKDGLAGEFTTEGFTGKWTAARAK